MDHLRCTRNSLDLCFLSSIKFFWSFFFFFKPGHGILSEKALAPHSSTLAWKIPWTEESSRLQSMGSLRVMSLSLFLSCIGEGNGNPLQCSCLENPRDGGAWWAAIYEVAQRQTRLKWLSSMAFGILNQISFCIKTVESLKKSFLSVKCT